MVQFLLPVECLHVQGAGCIARFVSRCGGPPASLWVTFSFIGQQMSFCCSQLRVWGARPGHWVEVAATLNSLLLFLQNAPWRLQPSPFPEATLTLWGLSYLKQCCLCCSRTLKELTSDISYCLVDNKLPHSKNSHRGGGELGWFQSYITHNAGMDVVV